MEEELTMRHQFPAHSSSPRQTIFSSSIRIAAAELLENGQFLVSRMSSLVVEMSTHGAM